MTKDAFWCLWSSSSLSFCAHTRGMGFSDEVVVIERPRGRGTVRFHRRGSTSHTRNASRSVSSARPRVMLKPPAERSTEVELVLKRRKSRSRSRSQRRSRTVSVASCRCLSGKQASTEALSSPSNLATSTSPPRITEEHRDNVCTSPEEVQVEETVCPPDVKQGLKRYHESLVRRKADAKARNL